MECCINARLAGPRAPGLSFPSSAYERGDLVPPCSQGQGRTGEAAEGRCGTGNWGEELDETAAERIGRRQGNLDGASVSSVGCGLEHLRW